MRFVEHHREEYIFSCPICHDQIRVDALRAMQVIRYSDDLKVALNSEIKAHLATHSEKELLVSLYSQLIIGEKDD